MKYTYITDYKNNDTLRKSFNDLTMKTFSFQFEEWYLNGFWGEQYIPHSFVNGDKVVANVSVNLMDFVMDGVKKHYIQIGTVMTDKEYRGQGLSRCLMEKVIDKYIDIVDGIYLFGNHSVVDFYPKYGFVKSKEYQYSKIINGFSDTKQIESIMHIDMSDKTNWTKFIEVVKGSVSNDRFTMDNLSLITFWTTGMMSNSVYYLASENAYIIAEVREEKLCIYQVIAEHKVDLETVIYAFGNKISKVILGFTPNDDSALEYKVINSMKRTSLCLLWERI